MRFSTNNFHDTWHILSDLRGARFIARLLWGLSYQRRPNTIVCIDPRFLDTNPFDAEPSDAIVFAPTPTSPFGAKAARDLDSRMPTGVGDGTVRWHTPGLDRFIDHTRHDVQGAWDAWTAKETGLHRHGDDLTITRRKGLLVFAAAPEILRTWALCAQRMSFAYFPMDYEYLDAWRTTHRGETGELQVFAEYRRMVSTARIARREVLSSSDAPSDPEHQRPAIWAHGDLVKRRSLRPRLGADLTRTRPR
ncbi:hypothetical protein CDO52_15450 [Nocardiopsis gilva YIM 90087]|uniref:Uncharacterized protein n=1 Tax=Nocardiopsis gilva YIM 90087 TaxID=1235441 RepID=A0A223S780_9ACTN|nr:hypothetical protein [Nocardiopsis gilva]ASU83994.1 hypothetical protein CDO52_15450 [Nocardiopsis gilva YIM 90087]